MSIGKQGYAWVAPLFLLTFSAACGGAPQQNPIVSTETSDVKALISGSIESDVRALAFFLELNQNNKGFTILRNAVTLNLSLSFSKEITAADLSNSKLAAYCITDALWLEWKFGETLPDEIANSVSNYLISFRETYGQRKQFRAAFHEWPDYFQGTLESCSSNTVNRTKN